MSPDISKTGPMLRIDLATSAVMKQEQAPPPHSTEPGAAPAAVAAPPLSPGATSPSIVTSPPQSSLSPSSSSSSGRRSRLSSFFHRHHAEKNTAVDGSAAHYIPEPEKGEEGGRRRLSQRLLGEHHHHHHNNNVHASTIPDELLHVPGVVADGDDDVSGEQWEKHASQLLFASVPVLTPTGTSPASSRRPSINVSASPLADSGFAEARDEEISVERAIELHENNEIAQSTQIFRTLADPSGENNSIAQVFYGLAKRHGWGCTMDPREAFRFLQMGAANAASLNEEAVSAGFKKNGAYAKKVLAMAIYELANCYRNAWGTPKDLVAARHYYETAANLGDTDAMCEAAWCFEKGCGGKKDKYQAAHYYRLARKHGVPMTGMSWIDKPAYQSKK
ncbi:Tetratricopeptide-like helical [Ascosphaera apis ARSEF 7405]|uniref:Tetratricopeptide-like helical n=1 Tax=Ascosphaera apis ARSEF 7405 TaxID=392613 RepID=A0A167WBX9_9EURO|nr:Tetratricopeptide-like helical [Ascosphaera apis ARSEF 7405]